VVLAGAAVLVAAAAFTLRPRPHRITRENYDRVQLGMSQSEVEAILGPPGDYRNGEVSNTEHWVGRNVKSVPGRLEGPDVWQCDEAELIVYRDPSGGVHTIYFGYFQPVNRDPLHLLGWHLQRMWHHWFPVKRVVCPG
jgi:hypothetical protein